MKKIILLILALGFLLTASAQYRRYARYKGNYRLRGYVPVSKLQVRQDSTFSYDSLANDVLARYQDSLIQKNASLNSAKSDRAINKTKINPYYYRLFVNPMLYRNSLKQAMYIPQNSLDANYSIRDNSGLEADSLVNSFFAQVYVNHPNLVNNTDRELDDVGMTRASADSTKSVTYQTADVRISDNIKPKEPDMVIVPVEAVSRKPNFWTIKANVSAQLQQFYFSDNWYQGGDNYNSFIVKTWITANYNNKQKIQWDNRLDMNLGFQTVKNDTEHKFQTNTDQIRMTNKLGVRASGRWYYTVQLQSWTQFYPKYSSNSTVVRSDFMSPFESVLSIGMDYKYNKNNFNLTAVLAPLAYDFKFVSRHSLINSYGTRGHHTMETIGSNITCNFTWKIMKELSWQSRLYYFTNYKKVQVEWENYFNFTINKYLSTTLCLYPRFDDSYHSSKSDAVIQFREYLSLGFNMSF